MWNISHPKKGHTLRVSMLVFCVVTPLRWRQYVPPKHWYLPTSPHGVTNHKTSIDIFTERENLKPPHSLRVSEASRLRGIFGTKKEEVTESWRNVSEFHSLCWPPNITAAITVIESSIIRLTFYSMDSETNNKMHPFHELCTILFYLPTFYIPTYIALDMSFERQRCTDKAKKNGTNFARSCP
jgi:hypothetical protein